MDPSKKSCCQCERIPAEGEKRLLRCSACMSAHFCGIECQRLAWKTHKPICILAQTNRLHNQLQESCGTPPTLPPRQYRIKLLEKFTDLHSWSIEKAFYAALTCRGGVNNFEYTTQFLHFELEYRPECGGNPGTAYKITSGEFFPLAEIQHKPGLNAAFESGRLMREESEARLRVTEKNFVGMLVVVWTMEDYHLCAAQQMFWNGTQFDDVIMRQQPSSWLQLLQGVVEKGHILKQIEKVSKGWHPGQMIKVGAKWKWKRFSDRELETMGLKARDKKFPGMYF